MGISREDNELLTRVGPGTMMGDLLRRYWMPALLSSELPENDGPQIRVTLLGEKLIAFRNTNGEVGLVDEFCAHRRVSLWFARNEDCGLRCAYHGWKYDIHGNCVDLPSESEESGMRQRIKLKAYPCVERGGVIWAYMGPPELKPELPGLEWANLPQDHVYLSKRFSNNNFMQSLEGAVDSSHVGFLHAGFYKTIAHKNTAKYNTQDLNPIFEVEDFGAGCFVGARRNTEDGKFYWRITPYILPFYTIVPPGALPTLTGHAWVPIDDENTWTWSMSFHPSRPLLRKEIAEIEEGNHVHAKLIPGTFIPVQNKANDYLMDRHAQVAGSTFSGIHGIGMQDSAVQESMGTITDRTQENLTSSDNGVLRIRRELMRAAKANRAGKPIRGLEAADQAVRSCAIVLDKETPFVEGAKDALYPNGSTTLTAADEVA